jgi:PQQ-like domain
LGTIEFLLYRLAGDKAPAPAKGNDLASRQNFRDSWQAWWKDNGKDLDAAKMADATRTLGCTLVVLLDQGVVIDLDSQNKARFQVKGLEFPLDVQYLPGDHVLVAEHNGNLVTERDKDSKIVWKKEVDQPLVAQRLADGKTFIATRNQILEVDKTGKETFSHTRPGGELIMRAQKLPNGDIAMVTQLGVTRYVRMDKNGKELATFAVDVRTSGGRIEVLPNGHVLIPENGNGRVVEHDAQGKIVKEMNVEQPIAASILPNGHMMVTSMNPQLGAMELDRNGKEIWHYRADTRVTRAYRR